jgi:hypothetical protein
MASPSAWSNLSQQVRNSLVCVLVGTILALASGCSQDPFPIARTDPYRLVRTLAVVDGQTAAEVEALGVPVGVEDPALAVCRCSGSEVEAAIESCSQRQKLCQVDGLRFPPMSMHADAHILAKQYPYSGEAGANQYTLHVSVALVGGWRARRTSPGLYVRVDDEIHGSVCWPIGRSDDPEAREDGSSPIRSRKVGKVLIESDLPEGEALVAMMPIGKVEDDDLYAMSVWMTCIDGGAH